MSDDIDDDLDNGVEENSVPDLRSVIEAARDAQLETKAEASAENVPAAPEEPKEPRTDGRDDRGRFAAKEGAAPVQDAPIDQAPPPVDDKPLRAPPIGWGVKAKADFASLPDHIQEAIVKREAEVDQGFKRYGGLKQYADYAEKNGTTLAAAVQDYAKIENGLRTNYMDGIDLIHSRFGIRPEDFIRAYAQRYGVSLDGAAAAPSPAYQQPAINPDAIVQQATAAFEQRLHQRESLSEIERFKSDPAHPYFENVREDMAILLQNGKASNLKDAYEMACWANPETRAILLKSQNNSAPNPAAAIQKAKAAAKAVGGAPSPGFNPGVKAPAPNMSIHDNIRAAIAAQRSNI